MINIPAYLPADELWPIICEQVSREAQAEPLLADFLQKTVLQHDNLAAALATILTEKLKPFPLETGKYYDLVLSSLQKPDILQALSDDLQAVFQRDSACTHYYQPLCFFKGYHALCAYRVMHDLWLNKQDTLALLFQNRTSMVFDVDIHPAARIASGVMLDHATGIVIGETAVVGNNVSIMQSSTLGGTGKESGDRHPKIGDGVLISVGAKILGNINIGEGAQITAGSVVLKPVAPHTTVAGVPAKTIGTPKCDQPGLEMNHKL